MIGRAVAQKEESNCLNDFAGKILSHPTLVLFHFRCYIIGDSCQDIAPVVTPLLSASEFGCLAQLEDLSLSFQGNGTNPTTAMYDFSQPDKSNVSSVLSTSPRYEKGNLERDELFA